MELTRPRKMELLHTPKLDLLRMMRENSLKVEDVIFLFASNKLAPVDIRMNAPTICDKLPYYVFTPDGCQARNDYFPTYGCVVCLPALLAGSFATEM